MNVPTDDKALQHLPRALAIQDIVQRHDVNQIIVAVKEQRGGNVPMDQLLSARIQACQSWIWPTFMNKPPAKCRSTA